MYSHPPTTPASPMPVNNKTKETHEPLGQDLYDSIIPPISVPFNAIFCEVEQLEQLDAHFYKTPKQGEIIPSYYTLRPYLVVLQFCCSTCSSCSSKYEKCRYTKALEGFTMWNKT